MAGFEDLHNDVESESLTPSFPLALDCQEEAEDNPWQELLDHGQRGVGTNQQSSTLEQGHSQATIDEQPLSQSLTNFGVDGSQSDEPTDIYNDKEPLITERKRIVMLFYSINIAITIIIM